MVEGAPGVTARVWAEREAQGTQFVVSLGSMMMAAVPGCLLKAHVACTYLLASESIATLCCALSLSAF